MTSNYVAAPRFEPVTDNITIPKVRFGKAVGFRAELRRRVYQYFDQQQLPKSGGWRIALKTVIALTTFFGTYVYVVWFASSAIGAVIGGLVFSQACLLIAFDIMHDGVHGAYSRHKRVNKLMAFLLELLGISNIIWGHNHTQAHHTYTNIAGHDNDISIGEKILRMSPAQRWRRRYRFQAFFAPFLYSMWTFSMFFFRDFERFFTRRAGSLTMPQFKPHQVILFFLTKIWFVVFMVVIPSLLHPIWMVLVAFAAVNMLLGLVVVTTFQLAHVVDGTEFPEPDAVTGQIDYEWAVHQVATTSDFAPNNPLVTWFLGGLNFQVVHHLFPEVSHVHYRKIQPIVKQTCADFGITYHCAPSVGAGIASHFRHLNELGRKPISVAV